MLTQESSIRKTGGSFMSKAQNKIGKNAVNTRDLAFTNPPP